MPKREKFTIKQVATALEKSGGFVSIAAEKLNTNPKVVYDYLKRHEKLREIKEMIEESYLDVAEASIIKKIRDGDTIANIFYLKTKGKQRGYVERTETEFLSNKKIKVVIK